METEWDKKCSLTPHIEKNVREQIRRLREDGITAMGMRNLFQVTPTPPQHLAMDESNIINDCPYCEADCPETCAKDGDGCDGWIGDIDGLAKDFQALSVNGDEGELIEEDEVRNLLMTLQ